MVYLIQGRARQRGECESEWTGGIREWPSCIVKLGQLIRGLRMRVYIRGKEERQKATGATSHSIHSLTNQLIERDAVAGELGRALKFVAYAHRTFSSLCAAFFSSPNSMKKFDGNFDGI